MASIPSDECSIVVEGERGTMCIVMILYTVWMSGKCPCRST